MVGFAKEFEVLQSLLQAALGEGHHQKSTFPKLEWAPSEGCGVELKDYSSSSKAYVLQLVALTCMDLECLQRVPITPKNIVRCDSGRT